MRGLSQSNESGNLGSFPLFSFVIAILCDPNYFIILMHFRLLLFPEKVQILGGSSNYFVIFLTINVLF